MIHLAQPGSLVTLSIRPGTYHLSFTSGSDTIDLTNINPGPSVNLNLSCDNISGPGGRLILTGGSQYNTEILSDNFHNTLTGNNVNKLTISNIHFKRDKVQISNKSVTVYRCESSSTSSGYFSHILAFFFVVLINIEICQADIGCCLVLLSHEMIAGDDDPRTGDGAGCGIH